MTRPRLLHTLTLLVFLILLTLTFTTAHSSHKDHDSKKDDKKHADSKHEKHDSKHEDHKHAYKHHSSSSSSSSTSSTTDTVEPIQPPTPGESTLVTVQIVSRHGTRAPNPNVAQLCPTDRPNLARYGDLRLTLAGLTGTGQKELYALGVFTRQTYMERAFPGFINNYFNDEEVYFRAVGEDRTIQSAVCMGQGMYPQKTAAVGYFSDLPSPVPIYTLPDDMDSLLEVRKKDCAEQLKKDGAEWDKVEGMKLYREHEDLIRRILHMCNITDLNEQILGSGDNYGDAIKDITDAWTFDMIEGFPPQQGLNYTSLLEFRTMAVKQLLGRIIGTEAQITYMNGQLPERLVGNFQTSITNQGPHPPSTHRLKMYAYHGHREMMYALGAYLGIEYDIQFPGLPKGAIPPATTLFFELHYTGERGPNGEIPNPWDAEGEVNPYLNRMVTPENMPHGRRPWGAPLDWDQEHDRKSVLEPHPHDSRDAPVDEEQTHAHKTKEITEEEQLQAAESNNQTHTPGINEARANVEREKARHPIQRGYPNQQPPSSNPSQNFERPTRTGEDELNGVKKFNSSQVSTESEHEGQQGGGPAPDEIDTILPHRVPKYNSNGLVKIPDSRMPRPPVGNYTVRAFLWHPCDDAHISEKPAKHHLPNTADCPAVAVKMTAICDAYECTMKDFQEKMEERARKTGTWDKLCHVNHKETTITADVLEVREALTSTKQVTNTPLPLDDQLVAAEIESTLSPSSTSHPSSSWHPFRWMMIGLVGILIYAGYRHYRKLQPTDSGEYGTPEEYVSFSQSDVDKLRRVY